MFFILKNPCEDVNNQALSQTQLLTKRHLMVSSFRVLLFIKVAMPKRIYNLTDNIAKKLVPA